MDKNVIRPRLYHLATVGHKEEFEQLQIDNEKQAKRIEELEERIEALEQLLVCYRVGKNPSEALHRKLEKTKQALKGGD